MEKTPSSMRGSRSNGTTDNQRSWISGPEKNCNKRGKLTTTPSIITASNLVCASSETQSKTPTAPNKHKEEIITVATTAVGETSTKRRARRGAPACSRRAAAEQKIPHD